MPVDLAAIRRRYKPDRLVAQVRARSIPAIRLLTPDGDTLAQAGLVAGILARTQDHGPG